MAFVNNGSVSEPAKNFHRGKTAISSFAICTIDIAAKGTGMCGIGRIMTKSVGSTRLCWASKRPPFSAGDPLLVVKSWPPSSRDALKRVLGSAYPKSTKTRVPGRGLVPALVVRKTFKVNLHVG